MPQIFFILAKGRLRNSLTKEIRGTSNGSLQYRPGRFSSGISKGIGFFGKLTNNNERDKNKKA